jgi:hypothetical protein
MPLVFCELALAYPPAKVSDPAQRIAAANGQFLLVEREASGHALEGVVILGLLILLPAPAHIEIVHLLDNAVGMDLAITEDDARPGSSAKEDWWR